MPPSVLQQLHVVVLNPGATVVLAHSLSDTLRSLVPNVIFADRATPIQVDSADAAQVQYTNLDGINSQSAVFLVQFDHTIQQAEVAAGNPQFQFYYQGAAGVTGGTNRWTIQTAVGVDSINAAIDDLILADATAGIVTVNLPAIGAANEGRQLAVKNNTDNTNFAINLVPAGADTIEDMAGTTPLVAIARASWTLVSDGVGNWVIV